MNQQVLFIFELLINVLVDQLRLVKFIFRFVVLHLEVHVVFYFSDVQINFSVFVVDGLIGLQVSNKFAKCFLGLL